MFDHVHEKGPLQGTPKQKASMFSRIFLILITFDSQISKKDRRGKDISRKILTPFDFNILYFFPDDVFPERRVEGRFLGAVSLSSMT